MDEFTRCSHVSIFVQDVATRRVTDLGVSPIALTSEGGLNLAPL